MAPVYDYLTEVNEILDITITFVKQVYNKESHKATIPWECRSSCKVKMRSNRSPSLSLTFLTFFDLRSTVKISVDMLTKIVFVPSAKPTT